MFNLYIYEKRLKDKKLEEKEKEEKKIKDELHIKKRDKLAEKFYDKTNNFLLEMIRKPIIINNVYYKPKENKATKSFCLFKFQTDRERIEKLLDSKNQYIKKTSEKKLKRCQSNMKMNFSKKYNQYLKQFNKDNNKHQVIDNINNHVTIEGDIINQPIMKFKPRNDLERILDSIHLNKGLFIKNKYLKFNKDFHKENEEKVLLKMHENNFIDNYSGIAIPYSINNQNNPKIILEKKDKVNKINNNKILKDKINLSNVVKNITEKYHSKTYFNSVKQAIICNYSDRRKIFKKFEKNNNNNNKILKKKPKKKRINYSASAINIFPKVIGNNSKNINGYLDINSNYSVLNKQKNKNKTESFDKNNNENSLDLSYNYNINNKNDIIEKIIKLNNPELNTNKSNNLNQTEKEALMILKKMSTNQSNHKIPFSSDRRKSLSLRQNYKGFYLDHDISNTFKKKMKNLKQKNKDEVIEDEKYIIINNYLFNKHNKNDLSNLGKLVLKKCHFINTKFDNDGKNKLKKGEGKLMITNGLSVNEFLNKHSLPK